ncbi:MAG TPA: XRE family transcriptional regulator [Burkholderiales bacterium]|nr:XRE family transcriptional regulator [Burkholderiales bacterium]
MQRTDLQRGTRDPLIEAAHADARERALKVELATKVNRILAERALAQPRAARLLGIRQLHVSDLARYRLHSFSVEHLMGMLTRLGKGGELRIPLRGAPK